MLTQLYRHFDKNGQLLYVGVSLSTVVRLSQHREYSKWYDQIANVTIQNYNTREEALEAETQAIKNENPKYNIKKTKIKEKLIEQNTRIIKERIEESKKDIMKRAVNFDMIYTVEDLERELRISKMIIKKMIDDKKLGAIVFSKMRKTSHGMRDIKKYYVTGWQLIDFIENCQATGIYPQ
jgi:hypothetical protein